MGSRNNERTQHLESVDTLVPYFQGFGKDAEILGGAELEIFLMRRADNGFAELSDYENFRLVESIQNGGGDNHDEPATPCTNEPDAGQLETQSRAYNAGSVHFISYEIATNTAAILRKAQELSISAEEIAQVKESNGRNGRQLFRLPQLPLDKGGIILCPFSVMPFRSRVDAVRNIISPRGNGEHYSDRPRIMMESFRRIMSRESARYPTSNTAVHFTHGAKDLRHAFEMTRLQTALMPFFFVLTENRPPYQDNSEQRVTHHSGIRARLSLSTNTHYNNERRGLTPDFVFAARDEHDFLRRMLDRVLNARMIAFYDYNNEFKASPLETTITPLNTRNCGASSIAQFELAMSEFWWNFKYKLPRNDGGLFHELRDFDSGPEVVGNIALIAGMLAMDDAARAEMIERLDSTYGMPVMRDPAAAEKVVRANMYQAYHRGNERINPDCGGRFMNTPFGANGHTMQDFLRQDLLPMLERKYENSATEPLLDNLRYVAQTGTTNAQMWHDVFGSQAEQVRKVHDMTADASAYHALANQGKSWAQHYDEGRLPALRAR